MESLDVIDHTLPRLGERCVSAAVDPLSIEHAEESLGRWIVGTVADGTHTSKHNVIGQELLIVVAGELRSPVRVQDDGIAALALPERDQHGVDCHRAILSPAHRPAHHLVVGEIDHDAQARPSFRRLVFAPASPVGHAR